MCRHNITEIKTNIKDADILRIFKEANLYEIQCEIYTEWLPAVLSEYIQHIKHKHEELLQADSLFYLIKLKEIIGLFKNKKVVCALLEIIHSNMMIFNNVILTRIRILIVNISILIISLKNIKLVLIWNISCCNDIYSSDYKVLYIAHLIEKHNNIRSHKRILKNDEELYDLLVTSWLLRI